MWKLILTLASFAFSSAAFATFDWLYTAMVVNESPKRAKESAC